MIKSPLNYTGGKFKLLPYIKEYLPTYDINTLIDLFCGGCNVSVNIPARVKYCNDLEPHIIDFYSNVKKYTGEEAKEIIQGIVKKYELSKENAEGFARCRAEYNNCKTWAMFYSLICYAFNYQIRFNSSDDYNMPFGKNRSSFNHKLQNNFVAFVDELHTGNYIFSNKDFREFDLGVLGKHDFVYVDPPYLASTVVYGKENMWGEIDEIALLQLLDELNERNIKFMLSNVFENKGKTNYILKEWAKKYRVIFLDYTYDNCNYHIKKRDNAITQEVLVVNY